MFCPIFVPCRLHECAVGKQLYKEHLIIEDECHFHGVKGWLNFPRQELHPVELAIS